MDTHLPNHAVEQSPKKSIGFWGATSLVIGNMIGAGIFMLPTTLAPFGGISILGWIATACGAMLLALTFARQSSINPLRGGFYAHARQGFGSFVGFQVSWNYWLGSCISDTGIAVSAVSYLSYFFPTLHENQILAFVVINAIVWSTILINMWGIRQAAIVQILTTIGKLIPLVLVGILGWFYFDSANFVPFNPTGESHFMALLHVSAITLWAFIGLESATLPATEVKNPKKTIYWATLVGLSVTAVIYCVDTTLVLGMLPRAALESSNAPFADAVQLILGPAAGTFIAIGALISIYGVLNGWTLSAAQMALASAEDGLFPRIFAKTTSKGVPIAALIIKGLVMSALLCLNFHESMQEQFLFLITFSVLTYLVSYLYSTLSEWMYYAHSPHDRQRPTRSAMIISIGAFIYVCLAMLGAGRETLMLGALLFFFSTGVYVWVHYHHACRAVRHKAKLQKEGP